MIFNLIRKETKKKKMELKSFAVHKILKRLLH